MKKNILFLAIITGIIFYFKTCTNPEYLPGEVKIVEKKVLVHTPTHAPVIKKVFSDSESIEYIKRKLEEERKKIFDRKEIIIDTVELIKYYSLPVDTIEILKDYFKVNIYLDTLRSEYGFVTVFDTVAMNRIFSRASTWNLTLKEREIYLKEKPKFKFYGGINLGSGLGPGFSVIDKSDKNLFGSGAIFDFKGSAYYIQYQRRLFIKNKK